MPALRVLIDPPGTGAWNMAVDEALLEGVNASGQATLRFYTWERPTVSLGYFQAARDRDLHARSRLCPLVRRSTGGGAIVHDRELTYSLVIPRTQGASSMTRLYEAVHRSLIDVLATHGVGAVLVGDTATCGKIDRPSEEPFLCFERRSCFDVVVKDAKIAGSAQRRVGRAVLQHGSVLLAASPQAPQVQGILEASGVSIAPDALAEMWLLPLAQVLAMAPERGQLSEDERSSADRLARDKYGSARFTEKR